MIHYLSTDGGFAGSTLEALNVVRLDQTVVHMSDLVHCDGKTIDRSILTRQQIRSDLHIFPREEPLPPMTMHFGSLPFDRLVQLLLNFVNH